MASQYERELRAVLAGIPKGVQAVTRSCDAVAKARAISHLAESIAICVSSSGVITLYSNGKERYRVRLS